jgi:hypothetical protein
MFVIEYVVISGSTLKIWIVYLTNVAGRVVQYSMSVEPVP